MLDNVIGQTRAKQQLHLLGKTYERKGTLPPVGFFGQSGWGKTHLATAWTDEMGAELIYISGTAIKDALAFRAEFEEVRKHPSKHHVIFIDECHNLPKKVQENMLSVLEEPAILCTVAPRDMGNIMLPGGKFRYIEKGDIIRENLPTNVSFILATTDPSKLKDAILNRLRKVQLEAYSIQDKIEIAEQHLVANGVVASAVIHAALAKRSRNIRHLKSDLCETFIDLSAVFDGEEEQLEMLEEYLDVDADGATSMDITYMEYLAANTTAGVDTLAARIGTDKLDLQQRIEPFLLAQGWVAITGRGRTLTEAGRAKVYGDAYEGPA